MSQDSEDLKTELAHLRNFVFQVTDLVIKLANRAGVTQEEMKAMMKQAEENAKRVENKADERKRLWDWFGEN